MAQHDVVALIDATLEYAKRCLPKCWDRDDDHAVREAIAHLELARIAHVSSNLARADRFALEGVRLLATSGFLGDKDNPSPSRDELGTALQHVLSQIDQEAAAPGSTDQAGWLFEGTSSGGPVGELRKGRLITKD